MKVKVNEGLFWEVFQLVMVHDKKGYWRPGYNVFIFS